MDYRSLFASFVLIAPFVACGGLIRAEPDDAGLAPDRDSGPVSVPDAAPPDGNVAPDAARVHGIAWVDPLDITDLLYGIPYAASSDGAGGIYVGSDTGAVVRVGSAGKTLWLTTMTTPWGRLPAHLGGVANDAQGNVAVGGDGLTLLAAADGHPLWNVAFQGTLDTRGVTILGDGTIVQVGFFMGTATFGATTLTQPASQPGWAGYFLRYDASGHALTASLMSDAAPGETSPFGAATDENGHLVLTLRDAGLAMRSVTFDASMHVLRSIALDAALLGNSQIAAAPGGAAYVSNTDLDTGEQNVTRIDPSGAVAWTFRPPPSFLVASALTAVIPDGPSGAVAWVDALWSIDGAGTGSEVVPLATLETAIAAMVGHPGWAVTGDFPPHLVRDAAGDVFVAGLALPPGGGGQLAPFVVKVQR